MKTKNNPIRLILAAMLLWMAAGSAYSQGYYAIGTTIQGNGFTYICDLFPGWDDEVDFSAHGLIRVRNSKNTLTDQREAVNGRVIPLHERIDEPTTFFGGELDYAVICNAASAVMTAQDRNNAFSDILDIIGRIDPRTGRVLEVEFVINPEKSGFIRITPEKLYHLETVIKRQFVYKIFANGKTHNFLDVSYILRGRDIGWTYNFSTGTWKNP